MPKALVDDLGVLSARSFDNLNAPDVSWVHGLRGITISVTQLRFCHLHSQCKTSSHLELEWRPCWWNLFAWYDHNSTVVYELILVSSRSSFAGSSWFNAYLSHCTHASSTRCKISLRHVSSISFCLIVETIESPGLDLLGTLGLALHRARHTFLSVKAVHRAEIGTAWCSMYGSSKEGRNRQDRMSKKLHRGWWKGCWSQQRRDCQV